MKEVCAGDGFENAVKDLGLKATRTFAGDAYEVWELDDDSFARLEDTSDDDWNDDWGWVCWADGCNLEDHELFSLFKVGKYKIRAWFSEARLNDYIDLWSEDDDEEDSAELRKEFFSQRFSGLCDYCSRMWGASMERNVTAITAGLAKLNNMTLSELWQKCGE